MGMENTDSKQSEYIHKCFVSLVDYLRSIKINEGELLDRENNWSYSFNSDKLKWDKIHRIRMEFCTQKGISIRFLELRDTSDANDDLYRLLNDINVKSGSGFLTVDGNTLTMTINYKSPVFKPNAFMSLIREGIEYLNAVVYEQIEEYFNQVEDKNVGVCDGKEVIVGEESIDKPRIIKPKEYLERPNIQFWASLGSGYDINNESRAWYSYIPLLKGDKINQEFLFCLYLGADLEALTPGEDGDDNILDCKLDWLKTALDFYETSKAAYDEEVERVRQPKKPGIIMLGDFVDEKADQLRKDIEVYEARLEETIHWLRAFFDFLNSPYQFCDYIEGRWDNPLSEEERTELLKRLCNHKPIGERPLDIADRTDDSRLYNFFSSYTYKPDSKDTYYSKPWHIHAKLYATDADREAAWKEYEKEMEAAAAYMDYDPYDHSNGHRSTTPEEEAHYDLVNGGKFTPDELADYYGYDSPSDYYNS